MKSINIIIIAFAILLSACSSSKDSSLESYNKFMYKTNKKVDKYTLKPIAKAYQYVTPDPIERGINNIFSNIREINTFANSLLQGKFEKAGLSSSRLVWNTILGIGGFFDVATGMNINVPKEDFGQTLRYWGVPAGPFIILPLLGPSTITDTTGFIIDNQFAPLSKWDWTDYRIKATANTLSVINTRASLLKLSNLVEAASTNEYEFVKNGYLQRRESLARDGADNQELEDDFDALFEDDDMEEISDESIDNSSVK